MCAHYQCSPANQFVSQPLCHPGQYDSHTPGSRGPGPLLSTPHPSQQPHRTAQCSSQSTAVNNICDNHFKRN